MGPFDRRCGTASSARRVSNRRLRHVPKPSLPYRPIPKLECPVSDWIPTGVIGSSSRDRSRSAEEERVSLFRGQTSWHPYLPLLPPTTDDFRRTTPLTVSS